MNRSRPGRVSGQKNFARVLFGSSKKGAGRVRAPKNTLGSRLGAGQLFEYRVGSSSPKIGLSGRAGGHF